MKTPQIRKQRNLNEDCFTAVTRGLWLESVSGQGMCGKNSACAQQAVRPDPDLIEEVEDDERAGEPLGQVVPEAGLLHVHGIFSEKFKLCRDLLRCQALGFEIPGAKPGRAGAYNCLACLKKSRSNSIPTTTKYTIKKRETCCTYEKT